MGYISVFQSQLNAQKLSSNKKNMPTMLTVTYIYVIGV